MEPSTDDLSVASSAPSDQLSEKQVVSKPMLTTAQKNFQLITHPETILSASDPRKVTRVDLTVPGSQCFLLHGLLSESECSHYISETEKVGYSDLAGQFPTDYRSNDRVISICESLVDELWRRIHPHLSRREVIRVRPVGFGNEGTWKPFRLNECCKFGRYRQDGHFSPHIDGPWVPREDESSIFTVVIYLNEDFEGGSTKFFNEEDPAKLVCSVAPLTGTALIFNHDTLHEGEPVTKGSKYIIRTEIMYRRVDSEMMPDLGAYQMEENYIRTLTLYLKSWELEQAGDVKGFTDTYLQAIQLQRQTQRSISSDSNVVSTFIFPYEVYLKIFGHLTAYEICRIMTVCKAWYDICMDGQLWYDVYRAKWPVGCKLQAKINPHTPTLKFVDEKPFLRDWYGLYKQRVKMKQPQKVVVLDLGSFSFKCAAVHRKRSTVNTASCDSVVALVEGVFDLHMRRFDYQRFFSGREAKENYPNNIWNIVVGGQVVHPQLLPEIITRLFIDCVVRPRYSPVIILEPPGLWNEKMKEDIGYSFMMRFLNPFVCFLSSAVAILCSVGLLSGVIVDVGHGVATCAAVWNGELCDHMNCPPDDATPTKLAAMIDTVIRDSCDDENQEVTLRDSVVLTGGMSPSLDLLKKELFKMDKTYSVRETADHIYAAVIGGCKVGNLCHFQDICKAELSCIDDSTSNYPTMPLEYFSGRNQTGAHFYSQYLSWFEYLNGSERDFKYMIRYADIEWLMDWKANTKLEGLLLSSDSNVLSGEETSSDSDTESD